MKKFLIGSAAVVVLLVVWVVSSYNGLVSMDVKIEEAWSQVQVQYQRRFDLIPNLVETVRGVADFERSTYEAVTEARSAWAQALQDGSRSEQIEATSNVESALSRLLVTVENYPQLRAQENFSTLQAQIEGTENRVAVSRRDYNQTVTPYNTRVRTFPTVLIAALLGFEAEPFFDADEGAESAPAVDFGSSS